MILTLFLSFFRIFSISDLLDERSGIHMGELDHVVDVCCAVVVIEILVRVDTRFALPAQMRRVEDVRKRVESSSRVIEKKCGSMTLIPNSSARVACVFPGPTSIKGFFIEP